MERLIEMGISDVTNGSRNVLFVCVTVMFCFVTGAAFGIERISSDGGSAIGLITILFTNLGLTVAALAALIKADKVRSTVSDIKGDTSDLLNGVMQKKIAIAVRTELKALLDEHLLPQSDPPRRRTH